MAKDVGQTVRILPGKVAISVSKNGVHSFRTRQAMHESHKIAEIATRKIVVVERML